jgi:hypothetical protein
MGTLTHILAVKAARIVETVKGRFRLSHAGGRSAEATFELPVNLL